MTKAVHIGTYSPTTTTGHAVLKEGRALDVDPIDEAADPEYYTPGKPALSDLEKELGLVRLGSWGMGDFNLESLDIERWLSLYRENNLERVSI